MPFERIEEKFDECIIQKSKQYSIQDPRRRNENSVLIVLSCSSVLWWCLLCRKTFPFEFSHRACSVVHLRTMLKVQRRIWGERNLRKIYLRCDEVIFFRNFLRPLNRLHLLRDLPGQIESDTQFCSVQSLDASVGVLLFYLMPQWTRLELSKRAKNNIFSVRDECDPGNIFLFVSNSFSSSNTTGENI